jgi:hypothetical protein
MMPHGSYLLYQIERPKSAAEIRCADEQIGQFALRRPGCSEAAPGPAESRGSTGARPADRLGSGWDPAPVVLRPMRAIAKLSAFT